MNLEVLTVTILATKFLQKGNNVSLCLNTFSSELDPVSKSFPKIPRLGMIFPVEELLLSDSIPYFRITKSFKSNWTGSKQQILVVAKELD